MNQQSAPIAEITVSSPGPDGPRLKSLKFNPRDEASRNLAELFIRLAATGQVTCSGAAEPAPAEAGEPSVVEVPYHELPNESTEIVPLIDGEVLVKDGGRRIEAWRGEGKDGIFFRIASPLGDGRESMLKFRLTDEAAFALSQLIIRKVDGTAKAATQDDGTVPVRKPVPPAPAPAKDNEPVAESPRPSTAWELGMEVNGHRLPEGAEWHWKDWTEETLPDGYRPLMAGEREQSGDEVFILGEWREIDLKVSEETFPEHFYTRRRTRRPTKVEFGPLDFPPGSVIKTIGGTGWVEVCSVNHEKVSTRTMSYSYQSLLSGFVVNRSLSSGAWDPEAWEPCYTLPPGTITGALKPQTARPETTQSPSGK